MLAFNLSGQAAEAEIQSWTDGCSGGQDHLIMKKSPLKSGLWMINQA
jgi:hypothetical protein